jgi:hypothetical protein
LERARRVPVERLLAQAKKQDKKLLLCGHVRPYLSLSPPPKKKKKNCFIRADILMLVRLFLHRLGKRKVEREESMALGRTV